MSTHTEQEGVYTVDRQEPHMLPLDILDEIERENLAMSLQLTQIHIIQDDLRRKVETMEQQCDRVSLLLEELRL
jgi:hypothetical protein